MEYFTYLLSTRVNYLDKGIFPIEKVTKNVFSLSFGQAAAFITNFVAIVFAIRFLGVENFGMFSSILAVVSILSKLVDFGIEPIVFREFSKDNHNYHFFSAGLNLRFLIYVLLVTGFNIVTPFLSMSSREILLSNILFLTILFSAKTFVVRELLATPFKVNLKMHYPMFLSVLDNVILMLLIVFIKFMKDPVLYFVIAYSVSNIPGFILSFYYLRRKFGYKYEFTFDHSLWLLKESLPMFGFVVLTTIFLQIDVVILNAIKGSYDVGIYSAGARLTMPLSIIPNAIVVTVFPILVKRLKDRETTEFITNLVIKLLYFISFVMAAVFTFESSALVTLIFGAQYAHSSLSASILYWCQVFIFFNTYCLSILIADNKQHYNFLYAAIQVVINVGLSFLLIPIYSYFGAAIAKLAASFASFIFIIYALNKFGFNLSIGRYRVLAWSIILTLVLWGLSILPAIPYLILSCFVIAIVTLLTGLFTEEEMSIFFKLMNREELGRKLIPKFSFSKWLPL